MDSDMISTDDSYNSPAKGGLSNVTSNVSVKILRIPPKSYSSQIPNFWIYPMDKIGNTIMSDDDLIEFKDLKIETYLQKVGEILEEDYVAMSKKHHIGACELVFETSKISYYLMYVDPCLDQKEVSELLLKRDSTELKSSERMNEMASILSPGGRGVFGNACLVGVETDLKGTELLTDCGREDLAMILSKRLNHTGIQINFIDGKEVIKEISINNKLDELVSQYTHREVDSNIFGISVLKLSGYKKATKDDPDTNQRLYIGFLDKERKVLRSLE